MRRVRGVGLLLAPCAALAMSACTAASDTPTTNAPATAKVSATSPAPHASACQTSVDTGVLPNWALGGFSSASAATIAHVLGQHGQIVAVLFNNPPRANGDPRVENKILWVSKPAPTGDILKIRGILEPGAMTMSWAVAGGPGPSGINFPEAGCWDLTLSWSGHTDTMAIPASPPAPTSGATSSTAAPPTSS